VVAEAPMATGISGVTKMAEAVETAEVWIVSKSDPAGIIVLPAEADKTLVVSTLYFRAVTDFSTMRSPLIFMAPVSEERVEVISSIESRPTVSLPVMSVFDNRVRPETLNWPEIVASPNKFRSRMALVEAGAVTVRDLS